MEEVKVRISAQGEVTVSVNGVKGKACKDLTKNLEKALGTVEASKNTEEYEETPKLVATVSNRH